MSTVELLKVEDRFTIEGRGIVLIPDFSVPDGWQDRTETVTVVTPDGQRFATTAQFSLTHFNIADPEAPIGRRWRVVVLVPDRFKEEIPAGSAILVSPALRDMLLCGEAA